MKGSPESNPSDMLRILSVSSREVCARMCTRMGDPWFFNSLFPSHSQRFEDLWPYDLSLCPKHQQRPFRKSSSDTCYELIHPKGMCEPLGSKAFSACKLKTKHCMRKCLLIAYILGYFPPHLEKGRLALKPNVTLAGPCLKGSWRWTTQSEIVVGLSDPVELCDSVAPQVIIWGNGCSVRGAGGLHKKQKRQEAAMNKWGMF